MIPRHFGISLLGCLGNFVLFHTKKGERLVPEDKTRNEEEPTIEDILTEAKATAKEIEKIKQEIISSADAITEFQTKSSTELSTISSEHDEIEQLLETIKAHSVEAANLHEKNQTQATALGALSANISASEQIALDAEESAKDANAKVKIILEEVGTHLGNSLSSAESAKKNEAEIVAILGQVTTSRDAVLDLHDKAKTDLKNIENIREIAQEADDRVLKYEEELARLKEQYETINNRIEKLLPGATSVGLAKAFNDRRLSLLPQMRSAQYLFLGSIIGFMALGIYGLTIEGISTISKFFIFVFERSPIVVGLVLLEEFGRRLYNHTLRLEEDYAYKETISLSFDGYKKALSDIDDNETKRTSGGTETLTKTLSSNVLGTLNERPGRIYEEKEKDINLDTVIKTLNPTGDATAGKVFMKLYGDLRQNLKGSAIKILAVIILVAACGIGAGYYFGSSKKIGVNDSLNFHVGPDAQSPISPPIKNDTNKTTTEK